MSYGSFKIEIVTEIGRKKLPLPCLLISVSNRWVERYDESKSNLIHFQTFSFKRRYNSKPDCGFRKMNFISRRGFSYQPHQGKPLVLMRKVVSVLGNIWYVLYYYKLSSLIKKGNWLKDIRIYAKNCTFSVCLDQRCPIR